MVLGNPPYITYRGKEVVNISNEELNKLILLYPNSAEYKVNSYALFTEKGIRLLRHKGVLSYIIPSTILQNEYLKKIREFIINYFHLKKIVSFSNKVFEAITDSIILFVANENNVNQESVVIRKNNLIFNKEDDQSVYIQEKWNNRDDSFVINIKTSVEENRLLDKIEKDSRYVEDFLEVYVGIVANGIKKFLSNTKINNNYKKYLQGKHIDKFELKPIELYINFLKDKLHSNTNEDVYMQAEKILVRKTGNRLIAVIDTEQYFTDQSIYNLYRKTGKNINLTIVTGLLNSKLLEFYFNKKMITNPDVFPYIKGIHLKRLPLKFPMDDSAEQNLISLITVIEQKKKNKENTVNEISKLNFLVFKLYNLTYDEVKVIDPEFQLSETEYDAIK